MTKKITFSEEELTSFRKALKRFHQDPDFSQRIRDGGDWKIHQAVLVTLSEEPHEEIVHLLAFQEDDRSPPSYVFSTLPDDQETYTEYYVLARGYRCSQFTRVPLGVFKDAEGRFLPRSTCTASAHPFDGVVLRVCVLDQYLRMTEVESHSASVLSVTAENEKMNREHRTFVEFVELAQADHVLRVIRKKKEKFRRHSVARPSTFYVLRTMGYDNRRRRFYEASGDGGCSEDEEDTIEDYTPMDRFMRIANDLESDANHPWNVLNKICRDYGSKRVEAGIENVVKQLEDDLKTQRDVSSRWLEDPISGEEKLKIVRESLPTKNMDVTPYWLAAEQSQSSASIPSMKLYQPQVVTHPKTRMESLYFTRLR